MQPRNGPPVATPCAPTPQGMTLQQLLSNPEWCCQWVWGLYEAYTALVSGNTRAEVRVADRVTRYSRGDAMAVLGLLKTAAAAGMCPTFPQSLIPGRGGGFSPLARNFRHIHHRKG